MRRAPTRFCGKPDADGAAGGDRRACFPPTGRKADPGIFAGLSLRQQALDVVQLHKCLLEGALRLSEESIREQQNLSYIRDTAEAIERVRSGSANVAFVMNAAGMQQVRDIAFAGEVLPQKSTDFIPAAEWPDHLCPGVSGATRAGYGKTSPGVSSMFLLSSCLGLGIFAAWCPAGNASPSTESGERFPAVIEHGGRITLDCLRCLSRWARSPAGATAQSGKPRYNQVDSEFVNGRKRARINGRNSNSRRPTFFWKRAVVWCHFRR